MPKLQIVAIPIRVHVIAWMLGISLVCAASVKVQGELPSLILSLSDKKLKQVLQVTPPITLLVACSHLSYCSSPRSSQIVQSIPLPPPSLTARPEPSKYVSLPAWA